MLSWLHGKNELLTQLHSFGTNEVLNVGTDANEVLSWLHDKNECWPNFGMNEV